MFNFFVVLSTIDLSPIFGAFGLRGGEGKNRVAPLVPRVLPSRPPLSVLIGINAVRFSNTLFIVDSMT